MLTTIDLYELYLENCHCRHLFLALGRQSEYYKVLETYADDDYTKLKTSLIEPSVGLPDNKLPFHLVRFSSIESVPNQIAAPAEPAPTANGSSTATRAVSVFSVSEATPRANGVPLATPRSSVITAEAQYNGAAPIFQPTTTNGSSPGKPVPTTKQPVAQAAPLASTVPPSTLQLPVSPVATREQQKILSPKSQVEPQIYIERNESLDKTEDSSSAGVVKLDTSSHSSYQSNKAAEQSWETATVNDYLPAPIAAPWGEEVFVPPPRQLEEQPISTRKADGTTRRQWRQGDVPVRRQERGANAGKPRQFEGSWDDMVQSGAKGSAQGSSPQPVTSKSSISSKSTDFSNPFTRQVVTKPEPNPQARPVCAPIAVNKLDQRIDLKLPRPAPADEQAFNLRTNNRHLCNEHHMRGECSNIQCAYDHEAISDGVYLTLRNKARFSPCNQGSDCRRHDCYLSHHCPNVSRASSCGRPNCPFKLKGLHEILDLDIVEMIEPPKEEALIGE